MRLAIASIFSAVAVALVFSAGSFGGDDKKPKFTIKQVMKFAHPKDKGILFQVASGEGTKEQKENLIAYYEALAAAKSPSGQDEDWTKRTQALVKIAKQAAAGEAMGAQLLKAANCKACHDIHKAKK